MGNFVNPDHQREKQKIKKNLRDYLGQPEIAERRNFKDLEKSYVSHADYCSICYTDDSQMTLTAHSLIAAAILSKISNPVVGLPLVLASHFIMDKVPHWDVMTEKNKNNFRISRDTLIDISLGFALAGLFFVSAKNIDPVYFFLGIFVSQLPDLLEAPYVLPQLKNPLSTFVYEFQHYIHDVWFDARLAAPWGVVTQIVIVLAFLLWAKI